MRSQGICNSNRCPAALLLAVAISLYASTAASQTLAPERRAAFEATGRVDARLLDILAREDSARALVSFQAPAAPSPRERLTTAHRSALRDRADEILAQLSRSDFAPRRRFEVVPGLAGRVTIRGLERLLAHPRVRFVALDRGGSASTTEARALIGADTTYALQFTGSGVTIAVLDTGIESTHPDLQNAVAAEACFCSGGGGCCPDGSSLQLGPGAAADDNGHGTHVAGILTSDGLVAPRGLAPDAALVVVKVLDNQGNFSTTSDVIAGLDWIAANRPDVDIVNLSLTNDPVETHFGHCDDVTNGIAELYKASIDALHANGVAVFAATGNHGLLVALPAPACIEKAISVSGVYDANLVSVEYGICKDGPTVPDQYMCVANSNGVTDLVAPGGAITSANPSPLSMTRFGTSQATPMAAGCAALLLEADPTLEPDAVDSLLKSETSTFVDPPGIPRNFPRLDCERALLAVPEPGSAPTALGGVAVLVALVRRLSNEATSRRRARALRC